MGVLDDDSVEDPLAEVVEHLVDLADLDLVARVDGRSPLDRGVVNRLPVVDWHGQSIRSSSATVLELEPDAADLDRLAGPGAGDPDRGQPGLIRVGAKLDAGGRGLTPETPSPALADRRWIAHAHLGPRERSGCAAPLPVRPAPPPRRRRLRLA